MEKILLITDNDLDGVGCDLLIDLVYGDNYEIEVVVSSDIESNKLITNIIHNETYKNYAKIFVCDLIIKENTSRQIDNILEKYNEFYLIDHHTSSTYLENKKYASIIVESDDIRHCATSILFNIFKEKFIEMNVYGFISKFVECVRLYDTWSMTPYTKGDIENLSNIAFELNILLGKLGYKIFKDHMKSLFTMRNYNPRITSYFMAELIDADLELFETLINEARSKMTVVTLKSGLKLGITTIHHFMYGYILNSICDLDDSIDLICTINIDRIAIRTRKDINILELREDFNNRQIMGQPVNAKVIIEGGFWLDLFNIKEEK